MEDNILKVLPKLSESEISDVVGILQGLEVGILHLDRFEALGAI